MATPPNPLLFLSAGEASGDHYGAQLIAELATRLPQATFLGLGGTEMEAAGQRRIVHAEDVAVMGITEILRHIPRIVAAYRRLVRALHRERPALAILIDFPDVNFRLAKHCKRLDIPVLWLVSPQLWAWKRRRLRWVQQRVAKMLVIFPFEAAFYRARNVDAEFIGHPLASLHTPSVSREDYAKQASRGDQFQWAIAHGVLQSDPLPQWAFSKSMEGITYPLDTTKPWIALLPGSRRSEIFSNLSYLVQTAVLLGDGYEYLIPIAETVSGETLTTMQLIVGEELGGPNPPRITFVRDARAALHHARAAVIASGTATVQALTLGTPFIVVYRVSRLTYALAKRLVRYPPEVWPHAPSDEALPIAMPNLIAGRRIVPELLNDNFTASKVAVALKPLLTDTPERTQMLADLTETRALLLAPGTKTPIERAADAAIALLSKLRG